MFVDENHVKLPKLYWLSKPHYKDPIANSNSCTTTKLSILLTTCLTAIKTILFNIVKQCIRGMVKIYCGQLKKQVRFLIN